MIITLPKSLGTLAAVVFLTAGTAVVEAGTVAAECTIRGALFNTRTRQHIQANFRGSGIHRPSGTKGKANGGLSSLINNRNPRRTILGTYRVLVRANVRYGGGSTSVSKRISLTVHRRKIVAAKYGTLNLTRPLKVKKRGRQAFRGHGTITVHGV